VSSPTLRWIVGELPKWRSRLPPLLSEDHDAECWEMARTLPPLNSIMFMAVNDGIQELLERYDVLSMSNGLEIRMPFLDWRLVSYVLSLPAESILGSGFTKRILRDAMVPYLPSHVVRRKRKLQFQGSIGHLLQKPLSSWMDGYPTLSRLAPDVLATGSYKQIAEFGSRVVAEWKTQTYPRLANARVAALRRHHRSDPTVVRRHTQTISAAS
jgi:asparagine synthetase B (glutamine-hydrolysing)